MFYFFLIIIFFASPESYAKVPLNQGILNEYLKLHKEFSHIACTNNSTEDFKKLNKSYLGDGRFIPTTVHEKLDYEVIKNFISLMTEKSAWIKSEFDFIQNTADFKSIVKNLDQIDSEMDSYFLDKKFSHVEKIKILLDEFKSKAPFLLSFKFPLDHLKLRTDYDLYKNSSVAESRLRANSIYFYRKIVQDGTFDEEMVKSDSALRAAFDTLYRAIEEKEKKKIELTDIDRTDLIFVVKSYSHLLKEGKKKLLKRFQEWGMRNNRSLSFYQSLLANDKTSNDLLLRERTGDVEAFKKFVMQNEAHAYEFWAKQSELMQALFVIETILYNEVGTADAPDALERRDIAQILINRFENPKYNTLSLLDTIAHYLIVDKIKINENKWLNVLFKEGEFSFTYFFIPGNYSIYCPDTSRTGQFYRRENVRIALENLNQPRKNFKALRYFSRVSMYGRISMDSLWSDFKALDETPGKPLRNTQKIQKLYEQKKSLNLYKFTNDELKISFQVIEVKNKKYVIDLDNTKNIYYYRSPHLFRYFAPIK
jgi:hypothetical protein